MSQLSFGFASDIVAKEPRQRGLSSDQWDLLCRQLAELAGRYLRNPGDEVDLEAIMAGGIKNTRRDVKQCLRAMGLQVVSVQSGQFVRTSVRKQ